MKLWSLVTVRLSHKDKTSINEAKEFSTTVSIQLNP